MRIAGNSAGITRIELADKSHPAEPAPDVSVIVVCWNSAEHIASCLASVPASAGRRSYEVVVVDNGSQDGTTELIRCGFADVSLMDVGVNLGFARAVNVALARARGRKMLLLNPDAQLQPGALERMADFLDAHPQVGAVGPRIMGPDGTLSLAAARELPTLSGTFFRLLGLRRLLPRHWAFARETLPGFDRQRGGAVPSLTGAAMLIPREVLVEAGGLDERLPMYLEDIDICARIGAFGKTLIYLPEAVVTHDGGRSTALSPARRTLYAMENGQAPWLFLRTYRGNLVAANFSMLVALGSGIRLLGLMMLQIFPQCRGAEWSGHRDRARILLRWALGPKRRFNAEEAGFYPANRAVPPAPWEQRAAAGMRRAGTGRES